MKKQYNAPQAEKVGFSYEQNVVASGYVSCPGTSKYNGIPTKPCPETEKYKG